MISDEATSSYNSDENIPELVDKSEASELGDTQMPRVLTVDGQGASNQSSHQLNKPPPSLPQKGVRDSEPPPKGARDKAYKGHGRDQPS